MKKGLSKGEKELLDKLKKASPNQRQRVESFTQGLATGKPPKRVRK